MTATAWHVCGCGCRPQHTEGPGCPCRQCQPGPGIDFPGQRRSRLRQSRGRMQYLLAQDFDRLSVPEQQELDQLLEMYLHGN